ncbi:MAG: UbiX family flavin prenyltransferase [Candidatus Aenigmatarchaeota archaeon]
MNKIIVAITGASGVIYGIRLAEELVKAEKEVYLVVSDAAKTVIDYEAKDKFNKLPKNIKVYSEKQIDAPIASSSFGSDATIICPCSMKTLASIAVGYADSLITRTADVAIKEKKKLIIVPRELPFSEIHLENMLKLSRISNVFILPACPGFYHNPRSIDDIVNFMVGKIMDNLGIENNLYKHWNGE